MSYVLNLLPRLIDGFMMSIFVFSTTLIISIPMGLVIALSLRRSNKTWRTIVSVYTWLIRGTPLLLQLYLVFYGLPLLLPMNIRDYRIIYAILTFAFNYTAYFVEIFKGSLTQIPQGQYDAARMLSMNLINTYRFIIIPQIIRKSLYTLANEAITLVKDTSLLAAVAIPELLTVAKEALSRDSRIDALVVSAVGYLIFTFVVVTIIRIFSRKMRLEVNL